MNYGITPLLNLTSDQIKLWGHITPENEVHKNITPRICHILREIKRKIRTKIILAKYFKHSGASFQLVKIIYCYYN
jgi:hypothetical protein